MIYCELPKLPDAADVCERVRVAGVGDDEALRLWLSLFRARTGRDLLDIESLGVDVMSRAVAAYRSVTASGKFKELERVRAKTRHNEASAIYNAEERGAVQGAEIERKKWQGVVAEKDAAIAELTALVAELRRE